MTGYYSEVFDLGPKHRANAFDIYAAGNWVMRFNVTCRRVAPTP